MDIYTYNLTCAILATLALLVVGIRVSRSIKSPYSFFHDARLRRTIVSYAAANITLGAGLGYMLSATDRLGPLAVLLPFGVFFGYCLLAFLVTLQQGRLFQAPNALLGLNQAIERATGKPSRFNLLVALSLTFVYTLGLGFEIFVSSHILAPMLFPTPSMLHEVLLSLGIFLVTLIWTTLGGRRAVYATDLPQLFFLTVLILLIAYAAITSGTPQPEIPTAAPVDGKATNLGVIAAAVSAFLMAVATQFYAVLNWSALSSFETRRSRRKMLLGVGGLTSVFLVIIVFSGLWYGTKTNGAPSTFDGLLMLYRTFAAEQTVWAYLASIFVVVGCVSIVSSTIDSVVISNAMLVYDSVLRKSSKSDHADQDEVRRVRLIVFCIFSLSMGGVGCMYYYSSVTLFRMLLSLAGGVVVYAPALAVALLLAATNNGRDLRIFSHRVVGGYFALFTVGAAWGLIAIATDSSSGEWIGLTMFGASFAYSTWVFWMARRKAKTSGPSIIGEIGAN